jgi:hypothetical protein
MLTVLRCASPTGHPIEELFIDLGRHSPNVALAALTTAVQEERCDMNAYEWLNRALPGAILKPALAFGSIAELYRSYTRPEESMRLKSIRRY